MALTDDPQTASQELISNFGATDIVSVETVLESPQVLVGTEDAIVEVIQRRREEYGVSYITVFAGSMETFAPVVARLRGT